MGDRTWTHTNPLPDGHTLFFTDSTDYPDLIAIADESGPTPEATDDGVLWLDFERDLMMGDPCLIPVKDPDSEERWAGGTDVATIVLLATWFNWKVNVRGILHRIEKVTDRSKIVPLTLAVEELDKAGEHDAARTLEQRFG